MTDSVPFLTAAALRGEKRLRHGFFTRQGGVSGGIYGSLNTGYGSDDDREAVAENRRRIAATLDLAALNTVYQVHGRDVARVTESWATGDAPKCDAMVTDRPGIALGILTADCGPVLFADAEAGVIGAAHAGWKGAIGGILQATVAAMEELGARRDRIAVSLGPTIAQPSYEVGPEFPDPFLAADPDNARFFIPSVREGHFMFDLPGFIESVLAGMDLGAVEIMAADTCADTDRFFSYRRATHRGEPDYGRGLSAIALSGS